MPRWRLHQLPARPADADPTAPQLPEGHKTLRSRPDPYGRALAHNGLNKASRNALNTAFASIQIASIYGQIENLTVELEIIAHTKRLDPIRQVNKALHPHSCEGFR